MLDMALMLYSCRKNNSSNFGEFLYSYDNKLLVNLSDNYANTFNALTNFLKFNKIPVTLDNIKLYINIFLDTYKKQKYHEHDFKKEINVMINNSYKSTIISTATNIIFFVMSIVYLRMKQEQMSFKFKLLIFIGVIIYVIYELISIECTNYTNNEISNMKSLKTKLSNVDDINILCIKPNLQKNRSNVLINAMLNKLIDNTNYVICKYEYNIDISNCDVSNVDVSNCDINKSDVSNIDVSNIDVSNIDVSNIDVSNIDVSKCDVSNCYISICDVSNCDVSNIDVSNCNINKSDVSNCDVSNCDINKSDVSNCNISNCHVTVPVINKIEKQNKQKKPRATKTVKPKQPKQVKVPVKKTKK